MADHLIGKNGKNPQTHLLVNGWNEIKVLWTPMSISFQKIYWLYNPPATYVYVTQWGGLYVVDNINEAYILTEINLSMLIGFIQHDKYMKGEYKQTLHIVKYFLEMKSEMFYHTNVL